MPIDNDYFKNRQNNNGGGSNNNNNNNGGGGNYQPPFEPPEFFKNLGKKAGIIYGIIAVVALLFVFKPFIIVESGQVGIKSTTGKYEEEPLRPGFHFYIPQFQKVVLVDTKVRLMNYANIETSGGFDQSIRSNPAISILDARGLPVSIELTVQYRLTAQGAPTTIANWGFSWEDKIINPVVRDIVRNVVGNYTAEELPTKRNEIAVKIQEGIQKDVDSLEGQPVLLQSVQLREIVLPQKIKDQIERVQIANQESERVRYEVLRTKQEAEKRAAKATGDAEANRIEAQGRADAVAIEAKAQATANKAIAQSLTPNLLRMQQIAVQGKFNEALRTNKDAKIFLTPGGSTPNIWVDTKSKSRDAAISQ
ncbi:SPFH domain-containing protein [Poseidonibacter lekithochrous]|uniref:SPFH domain-containing protein n=1 Tax=Poseidonibacter lekithochrous TaxID=1904463 RepID=UPI0008FC9873|nr:SPFH domain-containing protein [Poseidonibacter lekithochrous]QKJ21490.1 prohibitin family protein, SPFH superfamily [Poseidonibacter lekithochrous]